MVLLDTHAILWLDNGDPLSDTAHQAIRQAAASGGILVSPVSAWELGLLVKRARITLDLEPLAWFRRFLGGVGVRLVPLSVEAAVRSSFLPDTFHGDPADRLLVATARELDVPLVTRDRRILDHAAAALLRTVAC
jgi:PIN domain nuclease of toxin-antitoxin system